MNSVAETVNKDCLALIDNSWQFTAIPYFLLQEKVLKVKILALLND
jgi:hypothetical protein